MYGQYRIQKPDVFLLQVLIPSKPEQEKMEISYHFLITMPG